MSIKVIGFASWEPRCPMGWDLTLRHSGASSGCIFFYAQYAKWSKANRDVIQELNDGWGTIVKWRELDVGDPANCWRFVQRSIDESVSQGDTVVVDISTMPRDVIWEVFWGCHRRGAEVAAVYHKPASYSKEWLSRDPGRPRLVYKMAGVANPMKRSVLVITAGYDFQRAKQLFMWCEPEMMRIGLQGGEPFSGNSARMDEYRREFRHEAAVQFFEIDSYSEDNGLASVEDAVSPFVGSHNIILASLGPKISAIALYKLQRKYEDVALAYAPSNEFNRDYSVGLGESIWCNAF